MADSEKIISPMNFLKIFFRRKHFLIIPVILGLVFGICAGMVMPKKYESSTTILVEEGKSDNPLFDKIAVSSTVQERMGSIRESILGWNSLVELVGRLHLDKDVSTQVGFEKLILGLKKDIVIKMRGANLLELSYEGKNPELAKAIVENTTDIFISKNIRKQNQETSDAIVFIEKQLKVYKGKIKSAEIAKLQDQLNALLVDSTEKHPLVRQLKDQINSQKEELKKENLDYTQEQPLNPNATNPMIKEIQKAIGSLEDKQDSTGVKSPGSNGDIYKVMLMDKLDNVMARDVGVNEQIYNMLLQRLETAKITQRLQESKEGTRYTILDPPRVPLRASKPNRVLIALAGLFLGGFFGAGLVFASEFLDKSFLDVEDAKEFFGVPLLGAISQINTEENIADGKHRGWRRYVLTIIGSIILLVIFSIITTVVK
ncbi:MAG: hypothetical protein HQL26_01365 [Candidatus Omnitrophica bacterium]|nr:hypothetical protein [Candidatus Omnitrophota bacterium]